MADDGGERAGEVPLTVWGSGYQPSKARLRDTVVYRQPGPWSATVLSFLRHLQAEGFDGAPTVVGTGFAQDGRETVSFIPGASPQPRPWSDDAAARVGELLRLFHQAASTFVPPPGACWKPWFGRHLPDSATIVGHCDTGPWNIIARQGLPVALIDFEFAGPVGVTWELAQTAWLNAQLHDDDVAQWSGLPDAAGRAGQLRLILDGYQLPARQRADLVDKMIAFAVHSARAEAIDAGIGPGQMYPAAESGYPYAWAITWRVRSASWMITNRARLQRAIV